MRWPWIEQSAFRRYLFAGGVILIAAASHWLLFILMQARVPFLLFVGALVAVTAIAGRGPGALVMLAGAANATLQLAPLGSPVVSAPLDQLALGTYVVVGALLVHFGGSLRGITVRQYQDLEELHELSVAVSSTIGLNEQLEQVLRTLAAMHGTSKGVVALCDPASERLRVIASCGLRAATVARLGEVPVGQGARRLACVERRRVVIKDVAAAEAFSVFGDLASEEGIRAVHGTPLLSRSGELLGAITVFLPDARKPTSREIRVADICAGKASVAIERATAEDRASEGQRRFQTILEASSVPFVILEPVREAGGDIVDFRWNYVNAAAASTLGHTPEALVGRRVQDVLPGAWAESGMFDLCVNAVTTHTPSQREFRSSANGSVSWFHVVASPLDGMLAIWFADISERKHQEEMLRDADRRKDEFLATLAHELRNPLAPIRHAALIAHSGRASEAQKQWSYSVIERQVQHMSLLLDDLLDVSRITRGTLSLRKQVIDLESVLSAAVETARPLVDSRHHCLTVEAPESLRLNADPLRLSQIISNLLTNAAKYTDSGGTIRLVATEENGILILRVEDSGIGLREEDLRSIFNMFSQVGSGHDHSQGGLGIGLALTRGLVQMHGGSIEARSPGPGRGSVFTIRLPIGDVALAPDATKPEQQTHRPESRGILIADDNWDAAESLAIVLRLDGHEVVVANDGRTAFELFERTRPDVAFLDLDMPCIDGYELARLIRKSEGGDQVLLVAVTGWGQERDRRQSRQAGFDHHLTKPVEPAILRKLMEPQRNASAALR